LAKAELHFFKPLAEANGNDFVAAKSLPSHLWGGIEIQLGFSQKKGVAGLKFNFVGGIFFIKC